MINFFGDDIDRKYLDKNHDNQDIKQIFGEYKTTVKNQYI